MSVRARGLAIAGAAVIATRRLVAEMLQARRDVKRWRELHEAELERDRQRAIDAELMRLSGQEARS